RTSGPVHDHADAGREICAQRCRRSVSVNGGWLRGMQVYGPHTFVDFGNAEAGPGRRENIRRDVKHPMADFPQPEGKVLWALKAKAPVDDAPQEYVCKIAPSGRRLRISPLRHSRPGGERPFRQSALMRLNGNPEGKFISYLPVTGRNANVW